MREEDAVDEAVIEALDGEGAENGIDGIILPEGTEVDDLNIDPDDFTDENEQDEQTEE